MRVGGGRQAGRHERRTRDDDPLVDRVEQLRLLLGDVCDEAARASGAGSICSTGVQSVKPMNLLKLWDTLCERGGA
jgi:hypothetical protein